MTKKSPLLWIALAVLLAVVGLPLLGGLTMMTRQANVSENSVAMTGSVSKTAVSPMMAKDDFYRAEVGMAADEGVDMRAPDAKMMPPGVPVGGGFSSVVDRTIIRNAHLDLVVKDIRDSVTSITKVITDKQGFVTSSSVTDNGLTSQAQSAFLTLRVPSSEMDATLTQLRQLATRVASDQLSSTDQTEFKVDLEARLKNLRATETQLQTIMKQSGTVEDTLSVQRELTTVRTQIEQLQAQLDNLVGDASMATITVNLATNSTNLPVVSATEPSIKEELAETVRQTFRLYRRLLLSGIQLVIMSAPVLVLASVGIWLWRSRISLRK